MQRMRGGAICPIQKNQKIKKSNHPSLPPPCPPMRPSHLLLLLLPLVALAASNEDDTAVVDSGSPGHKHGGGEDIVNAPPRSPAADEGATDAEGKKPTTPAKKVEYSFAKVAPFPVYQDGDLGRMLFVRVS